jgi:hypothetical protein
MSDFIPKDQTKLVLSEWQIERGNAGICRYLTEFDLLPNPAGPIVYPLQAKAKARTVKEYQLIVDCLRNFAILCEDYQTACVLTPDKCPDYPSPPRAATLCEFMRWKTFVRTSNSYTGLHT